MTIINVIPDLVKGGGEIVARHIHEGLLLRGLESKLVYVSGDAAPPNESIHLNGKHARDWMAWRRLRGVFSFYPHAIVHCHMFPSQLAVRILAPSASIIVTTEHSTYNRRREMLFGRMMDKWMFKRFSAVVCISDAVRASIQTWLPDTIGRSSVIGNGIDLQQFRPASFTTSRRRLVSVGRLEHVKGFDVAIEAVAMLIAKGVAIDYDIYGEGPLRQQLQKAISAAGLDGVIKLRGWTDGIHAILPKYSINVMPSRWEGFGLAAVEAMACGLPVVASDIPGLGDIVTTETGVKCTPQSSTALANAITRMLELPEAEFVQLKNGARAQASKFSVDVTISQYIELYRSLTAKAR